ncbi:MAG: TerC family protein [Verrucomicrobiota bacterium]
MENLPSLLVTLFLLVLLQAVLGFDNLLYISLESKKAPENRRARVRTIGITLAIVFRIVLLFVLLALIDSFQNTWFKLDNRFVHGEFNFHSIIVLLGGVFIIYTATKEVIHMMALEEKSHLDKDAKPKSEKMIIFWIILMNLVFSFDSILSAMALTDNKVVMSLAIVVSGILMIWMSDRVSTFLQKNRLYEVLGLFILFVVGIMLLSEGAHLAHLSFFGNEVTAMSKTTFYFVIAVLVLTDVVQSRYQKKILAAKKQHGVAPADI